MGDFVMPAWVGVWMLTSSMSANNPRITRLYTRATRHISSADSAVTIVFVRDGAVHLKWMSTLDRRDYQVEGVQVYLPSAYRQIDDHTLELTQKLDGRAVVHTRLVLSADGKTLTAMTTDGITTTTTTYAKSTNPVAGPTGTRHSSI